MPTDMAALRALLDSREAELRAHVKNWPESPAQRQVLGELLAVQRLLHLMPEPLPPIAEETPAKWPGW